MNHEDQYYKKEIVTLAVAFEISYKKDSPEGREDAIRRAIKDVPYRLSVCGEHGCYSVERKEVSLTNAKGEPRRSKAGNQSGGFLGVGSYALLCFFVAAENSGSAEVVAPNYWSSHGYDCHPLATDPAPVVRRRLYLETHIPRRWLALKFCTTAKIGCGDSRLLYRPVRPFSNQ